ncbi:MULTISPECIES: hypothetical protein [unclassified Microcoleus]
MLLVCLLITAALGRGFGEVSIASPAIEAIFCLPIFPIPQRTYRI